ncbi:ABC transporter permease [Enterococcus olivae]
MKKQSVRPLIGAVTAAALLLGIWWMSSVLLAKPLLPSPFVVLQRLPELFREGILQHLQTSFYRVLLGIGYSIAGGFLLGLTMGSFPKWNPFFDPLIYLTYPIPKMALLPIVMLLGGLGDLSKIVMIILIVLPQVTIAVRDAVREVPKNEYDVYRCLQASRWQQFTAITFPATLPAIFSATRVSLGTALSILFFTENYGTEFGMGYFIMDSWTRMDYPAMYAGILILSSFGFLLFGLMDLLAAVLFKWQKKL